MPQNVGYFSYAWGLLKRDKGWPKVVLLLGLASLVPVVGWLGVAGYVYEWARLTAWGVDAAPKQTDVKIGECIRSGWRVFVSSVGWLVAYGIVAFIVGLVPFLGGLVVLVANFFMETFLVVCAIRAAIYQDFTAGYQANRIFEMIKRDFSGFAKVTGITLLIGLVLGIILMVVSMIVGSITGGGLIGILSSMGSRYDTQATQAIAARALTAMFITSLVVGLVGMFLGSCVECITVNMVALWMRQFNVPSWGASDAPLPGSPTLPTAGAYAAPQAAPYQQQPGYGQPQQAVPQQQAPGYQQPPVQQQAQPQPYQQQGAYQQPMGYQQPQPTAQQGWQQPSPQPSSAPAPQQAATLGYPAAAPQAAPQAAPAPAQPSQPAPVSQQPAAPAAAPVPQPAPAQPQPQAVTTPAPQAPSSASAPAAAPTQQPATPASDQAAPSTPAPTQGDSTDGTLQQ